MRPHANSKSLTRTAARACVLLFAAATVPVIAGGLALSVIVLGAPE